MPILIVAECVFALAFVASNLNARSGVNMIVNFRNNQYPV